MSHGETTKYAPKVVPSQQPKPSFQSSKVNELVLADFTTFDIFDKTYPNRVFTTTTDMTAYVGDTIFVHLEYDSGGLYLNDTFNGTVATASRIVIYDQFEQWGHTGEVLTATWLMYQDGFTFDDVSWWQCATCGIPWRKFQLKRHQITGKFVCPSDYDELGKNELEAQNQYRMEALRHAGDMYVAIGEFP